MSVDADLRALVTDLAGFHREDIEGVLANLDAARRAKVEALLAELSPLQDSRGACEVDATKISPWLCERMFGQTGSLTEDARGALKARALALFPASDDGSPRRHGRGRRGRGEAGRSS